MKKNYQRLKKIIYTIFFSFLFISNLLADAGSVPNKQDKHFADKGIIELGGIFFSDFETNSLKSNKYREIEIGFNPFISYFVVPFIHIDLSPGISYNYYSNKINNNSQKIISKSYILLPTMELGYVFVLKRDFLFFDLSVAYTIGYYLSTDNSSTGNETRKDYEKIYSVIPKIKIDTSNGLINIGILTYRYQPDRYSKHQLYLFNVGYSVYF